MRPLALVLFPLILAAAFGADTPTPSEPAGLRMNDIQTVGTHNSYKSGIPADELAMIAAHSPKSARTLDYRHPPLEEQLDLGMRQLEIDILYDPVGGRFAHPALPAMRSGKPGATAYDAMPMLAPGYKVLHVPDIDVRSHCASLVACLTRVRAWSDRHRDHMPLLIMMNVKTGASDIPGGTVALPFDAKAADALDVEIRSVFSADRLIVPDLVRGAHASLREGAMAGGWPSLHDARGKVFFALDEGVQKVRTYMRGHESLQGLPVFVNSIDEGQKHAAYFTINEPIEQFARIQAAVKAGFVVRTRADADTAEARGNFTGRREAAFASGAQYVSTDYERPRADFGPYAVSLPGGGPVRCNPVRRGEACQPAGPVASE